MINTPTHMCMLETHDLKDIRLLKAYRITITLNTNMSLTNSEKLLLCSKQLAYMKEYLYSINGRNKYQYKVISKVVVRVESYVFRMVDICDKYLKRGNFFKKVVEKLIFHNVTNIHWERFYNPLFFLGKRVKNALKHTRNWIRKQLNSCRSYYILTNKYM
jgi:ABC-type microcin C transport system duplicated ATPase subunit YejF